MKARKRLGAFLLDLFIVVMLSTTLSNLSYLNPYKDKYNECQNRMSDLMIEYEGTIKDISNEYAFTTAVSFVNDKMLPELIVIEKYDVFNVLWYVIIFILYNVVFAYFNNGQTIGKKLFKLRVVNKGEDKVSFIRMFIRSLFTGSSLFYGVTLVAIIRIFTSFIINKYIFLVLLYGLGSLSLVLEISLLITLFTSKGSTLISDKIARTEVIDVK